MNNTTLKHILYISIGVTCVVIALFVFGFKQTRDWGQAIALSQNEFLAEKKKQEYLLSVQQEMEDQTNDIVRIKESIVDKEQHVDFIKKIEELASTNNVSIVIETLSDESSGTQDDPVFLFSIRGKTTGSWSNTASFIAQLETFPQKIKINELALLRADDGEKKTNAPLWNSVFRISVLKYK